MNLFSKVHKLKEQSSLSNIDQLKCRPIITTQSWVTSKPSKLLGYELDSTIPKLKTKFSDHNLIFPATNSTDELK